MRIDIGLDPAIAYIGSFELGWHGLLTALAVLVAGWIGVRRAGRRGFSTEAVSDLLVWAVLGGLIGARIFHVLDHLPDYLARPLDILAFWQGGMAVYGGFVGGIAGGYLAARRLGLPAWPLLDAAAPAMLVGQAIGRVGCFLNGDAWGAPTGADWGVVYWHAHALLPAELLGVPTHPYPLYEIAATLVALGLIWAVERRPALWTGASFALAALSYALIRFGLSFYRQETLVAWGLQEAQLVAIGTALLVLAVSAMRWRASRVTVGWAGVRGAGQAP